MKKHKKYRLKKHIKRKVMKILVIVISLLLILLLIKKGLDNYDKLARECDQYYGETCTHYDINIYKNNKINNK